MPVLSLETVSVLTVVGIAETDRGNSSSRENYICNKIEKNNPRFLSKHTSSTNIFGLGDGYWFSVVTWKRFDVQRFEVMPKICTLYCKVSDFLSM